MLFLGRFRLGLLHRNIFLGTNLFNVEATIHCLIINIILHQNVEMGQFFLR